MIRMNPTAIFHSNNPTFSCPVFQVQVFTLFVVSVTLAALMLLMLLCINVGNNSLFFTTAGPDTIVWWPIAAIRIFAF